MRSKLSLLTVAVVLAAVATALLPTAASATAQSCTRAGLGVVCNTTYGSRAYVDRIVAIRDKGWDIPNPSADASVLDGHNHAHVLWFQHQSRTGSFVGRAWFNFYPRRNFLCGDVTSVRFYENRTPQGGYANVRLC